MTASEPSGAWRCGGFGTRQEQPQDRTAVDHGIAHDPAITRWAFGGGWPSSSSVDDSTRTGASSSKHLRYGEDTRAIAGSVSSTPDLDAHGSQVRQQGVHGGCARVTSSEIELRGCAPSATFGQRHQRPRCP